MKLNYLNESDWSDAGIQNPNKKPMITNSGYLLQSMVAGLDKNEWTLHAANYTADSIVAQIMDKKTGIFYSITIKAS